MAATTQILYNSPALRSLKRDQLVKLCKTHSLKANGKNTELIERLKKHALELGQETFFDNADTPDKARQKEKENINDGFKMQMPRPSEQWEIVMEDIQEVPEPLGTVSSKGTITGIRGGGDEFGSKTSTVSSSIRALANSLGIKRASDKANASLTKHSVPFEDLPPATPPHFEPAPLSTPDVEALKAAARAAADGDGDDGDVSMSAPVPGSPSRPGAPAPENARLSMGQGPTTTIRLISSKQATGEAPGTPVLPTFQTNFDLILGSPNPTMTPGRVVSVWPASPERPGGRLYPSVPFEDLFPAKPLSSQAAASGSNADMPGGTGATPAKKWGQPHAKGTPTDATDMFSPMRPTASSRGASTTSKPDTAKLSVPRDEPFLFGSPLPRHSLSNQQFSATAQGLVAEMHRRLAEQGKAGAGRDTSAAPPVFGTLAQGAEQGSPDRFAKAHEARFNKMDSIANHYAARRPLPQPPAAPMGAARNGNMKRKSDALGLAPAPGQKRKSSAAGARVISAGARKRMAVPGGFGADDDDDEESELIEDPADRRSSKRVRVSEVDGVHNGKRVSIAPPAGRIPEGAEPDEEEAKKQKEREAIRRRLEANKARRRSSRGRVSVGGKAAPPKAKPSRFGFFASAKTLVKNVWNIGAGAGSGPSSKPAAAPAASSSIPVAKPTQAAAPAKPAAPQNPSMRSTTSTARKSSVSTSAKLQKPRPESQAATASIKGGDTIKSSRSSVAQTRGPIPSFASPPSGTASSRMSTSTATSKIPSRPSSIAGASSLGTRTSLATKSQSAASSIGTRRSMANASGTGTSSSTRTSTASSQGARDKDHYPPPSRARTSSLLSPTASSLARTVGKPDSGVGRPSALPAVVEQPARRAPRKSVAATKATLHAITNSPRSPQSPRATKIFAQPLTADTLSSPLSQKSPAHHTSLAAAATALASPSRIPTAVPPRPKGLIAKRPRISRTRVIAKTGAQRDAQPAGPSALAPAPRVRSSVGARKSLGGVKSGRASASGEAARLAVKKRARQSEYARRRSRASGRASMLDKDAMDVDD